MEQNYLPLFRKYRPQSFKDIVGQESLVKALTNAIELNRIANAYLFCGPRGTGKTSSARILAKSLNCEHGPTLEPCQKCASCVDITNATGLDVIEIDAASNRGIQDAKELISQVQYAPINGKYKIFIIDEVHMLSNDAFNALLKTFEEPPKNVIFILATTEPHKVLETIVSRCQRFDLRRITTDDIIKRLREISDLENIKITDDALFTIAKNVSGGLRDSLALLDQVSILGVKEEIGKDLIEELLGKVNFDVLLNLLNTISGEDIEHSVENIENIYTKGNEPRNLAENFIEFLRNVILVLNSSNDEIISKCTTLIKEDIQKIRSCNFEKDKTVKILNTFIEYYKEIKVSTNPYLWMELAAISACRLDLNNIKADSVQPAIKNMEINKPAAIQKDVKSVIEKIHQEQKPIETHAEITQEVPAKTTAPVNKPAQEIKPAININTGDVASIWTNIIQAITSLPAKAFYTGVAKLVKIEDKKITLGFLHENALIQAKSDSKLSQLKDAISKTYSDYTVDFIKIDANTQTVAVKPKIAPQRPREVMPEENHGFENKTATNSIKQSLTDNQDDADENNEENKKNQENYSPKVKSMIEQFNGRIIE